MAAQAGGDHCEDHKQTRSQFFSSKASGDLLVCAAAAFRLVEPLAIHPLRLDRLVTGFMNL